MYDICIADQTGGIHESPQSQLINDESSNLYQIRLGLVVLMLYVNVYLAAIVILNWDRSMFANIAFISYLVCGVCNVV